MLAALDRIIDGGTRESVEELVNAPLESIEKKVAGQVQKLGGGKIDVPRGIGIANAQYLIEFKKHIEEALARLRNR